MPRLDQTQPGDTVAAAPSAASITPLFPLLLLETMRDMDRPTEVLEDEDLSISMPRRLGLSDVVGVQIRRFQQEVKQRRLQSAAPVEDLIRLVIRRPDAEEIFSEAGRRIARHFWNERSRGMRATIRLLPRPLATFAANRAGRRIFRRLTGRSRFSLQRWPIELRIENSLTARADAGGEACGFYAGTLEEILHLYVGRRYGIRHPRCETRGDGCCQWSVEVTG